MLINYSVKKNESVLNCIISYLENFEVQFFKHENSSQLIICEGSKQINKDEVMNISGVESIVEIETPYKLASKKIKENTIIDIKGKNIGAGYFNIIAGPCSLEDDDSFYEIGQKLNDLDIGFMRGGIFKPRTSPYKYQGRKSEGLNIIKKVQSDFGMRIVSEAVDIESFRVLEEVADIIQIGTRNMQNYELLKVAGKSKKPIILKRGFAATVEEWLLSAEYILKHGNPNVILCERGIRTYSDSTRFTLDLSVVPIVKSLTHLPVIIDPSHGTGKRELVRDMSRAAVACGADGLLLEVHTDPYKSICDGRQTIDFIEFEKLISDVQQINNVMKNISMSCCS